jgi:hypothetical protein
MSVSSEIFLHFSCKIKIPKRFAIRHLNKNEMLTVVTNGPGRMSFEFEIQFLFHFEYFIYLNILCKCLNNVSSRLSGSVLKDITIDAT